MIGKTVSFTWNEGTYSGSVEREYVNSILVHVENPCAELEMKYQGRIVISKKDCLDIKA